MTQHPSYDALVASVRQRADDIDEIWITVGVQLVRSLGQDTRLLDGAAVVVKFCGASDSIFGIDDGERLLNEPFIRSLRVPFRFLRPGETIRPTPPGS